MESWLVIDTGSSSMKALLFSAQGTILCREQIPLAMENLADQGTVMNAFVFRDALYQAVQSIMRQALGHYEICAISFTSQRSALLPLSEDGSPLSPVYMWYDKRSRDICERINGIYGDTIYQISGMRLSPLCTAPKILWLREQTPHIYASAHKLVGIHDYLLFLSCGEFVTDTTLASRTAMLDIKKRNWSDELLSFYQIDRSKLCALLSPGDIAGYTTKAFSSATGCPQGIPVITAGGDQQSSILGQGITHTGIAALNSGTGSFLTMLCDAPAFHTDSGLSLNDAVTPDQWVLEGSVLGSGSIYQWFQRNFYTSEGSVNFDSINHDIASIPAGADGLLCISTLAGAGTPSWNPYAKGTFFNLGLYHTKAHMGRALLEGIVSEICLCYRILTRYGDIQAIQSSGGLTNFPLFNQILSDMLMVPVSVVSCPEATAIGALVTSLVSLGIVHTVSEYFQTQPIVFKSQYYPDETKHNIYETQEKKRTCITNLLDRKWLYE